MKVSRTDPVIRRIIERTYPNYRGRKVALCPQTYPLNCASYWDGGSRSYFVFLGINGNTVAAPAQSAFDPHVAGLDNVTLPPNVVCVEHVYFCGKDCGLRIHYNPATPVAPALPAPVPALEVVS
jgi:hypothetical protein